MKAVILLALVSACATLAQCGNALGFRVSNTTILDKNGNKFLMRGINHSHTFHKKDWPQAIPGIARTGTNVIRLVLSNGDKYTKDDAQSVKQLLDLCALNNLIAIVGEFDESGSNDASKLDRAADYWLELSPVLKGLEDRVIVNIANEWHASHDSSSWAEAYKTVVAKLRAAGLSHLIVIDTAGWGQYAAAIAQKGREVFESDPLRNLVFSIHMYQSAAPDAETVKKNIDDSLAIGVPLIIGEFSTSNKPGHPIAYEYIMEYTHERSVGWLFWFWHGSSQLTDYMAIAKTASGDLSELGEQIINGKYGIKATSKPATIW